MPNVNERDTSVVINDHHDDPQWVHAIKAAVMHQGGWTPTDEADRLRLLETIHDEGYPRATLELLPPEGPSLPRVNIRRDG
jgi:hypothetical protein